MHAATVSIIDDDSATREAISRLVESMGLLARSFVSPQDYLASYSPNEPGCLVMELRMPGLSGLELQQRLIVQDWAVPIIFLTGFGDVSSAVAAMKAGAVDFFEKPFRSHELWERIRYAIDLDALNRSSTGEQRCIQERLAKLTPGETEVLSRIVSGRSKQDTAKELGLSVRTIEVRRSKIMRKLEVSSLSDLIRVGLSSGISR